MSDTTRTEIPVEVNNFYNRTLLDRAVPALLYNRFAQIRDIPANSGTNRIKFRKYGALTSQTTALIEGVTPSGKQLSVTDIYADVLYYGDYVTLTDVVLIETFDPILTETADILGEQVGLSLDDLCKAVVIAGASEQFASTATAVNEITSAMKMTREEIKEGVRTLRSNNAKPITSMIDPSTGYNTVPVGASFVMIVSEDTLYDIEDAAGWTPVEKYPNKSDVMPDEKGSIAGVRVLMSTNAYVESAAGADSQDVHGSLIIAQNAYAQTRISGMTLQNIVKPLGSAGTADPLNQRTTSGWKLSYVAKVLDALNLLVIYHSVSD